MQKNNLIKRYFLWAAPSPFVWGALLGGALMILGSAALAVYSTPPGALPDTFMQNLWLLPTYGSVGLGLVSGGLHWAVCRRFISYSREPVLFFLANEDVEIILDAEGKVTAGERLWVPRGLKGFRVRLASTTHTCEIDPSPGSIRKIPLKLEVSFKGEFDPQEVYERIVRDGYRSFNWLVRKKFLVALKATAGLEQTLPQFREHSSVELEEELEKMRPHFSGPDILSNIKKIDVKLKPEATVSF